jgi:hypothetical protein
MACEKLIDHERLGDRWVNGLLGMFVGKLHSILSQATISSSSSSLPTEPPSLSFVNVRKSFVAPGGAIVHEQSSTPGW